MDPDYDDMAEENDILITCALRFDGHQYVENQEFDHMAAWEALEQTMICLPIPWMSNWRCFS